MIGGTEVTSAPAAASATRSWEAPKESYTRGKKAIRSFSMAYVGFRWARSPVWTRYEDRKWDRSRRNPPCLLVL